MADLPTRSLSTIVASFAAGVQGRAAALIDFSEGSPLLAIGEGMGSVMLWLQALVLQVLARTRAATSSGTDLDTWMADFGLTRIGANYATTVVTFNRFTADVSQPPVPVGSLVRTLDNLLSFVVTADPTNLAYDAPSNSYLMPSNGTMVTCPVMCTTPGSIGNVVANMITQIASYLPNIDTVNNSGPATNGADAETDTAFRTRFQQFIASLSKGTIGAIQYCVSSLLLGLQATIIENTFPNGAQQYGFLWITVDDGSGEPPATTINAASTAIAVTRAAGIMWGVYPPTLLSANLVFALSTAVGYDHNTLIGLVNTALSNYVNSLALGQSLSYSQLMVIAMQASPGITSVGLLLNGGFSDMIAAQNNTIRLGSIAGT